MNGRQKLRRIRKYGNRGDCDVCAHCRRRIGVTDAEEKRTLEDARDRLGDWVAGKVADWLDEQHGIVRQK